MRPIPTRARPATLRILLLAVLLQAVVALQTAVVADPQRITLTILHTNDMHGHLLPEIDKTVAPASQKVGGAAWLAGLIRKVRAASTHPVLLIDGGDIAQGTPISNIFEGRPMVEFMNGLDYDAGTLGNHEFDWGAPALSGMILAAKRPIVCANVVDARTGKAPIGVKRFITRRLAGATVGITGLVTPTTPNISFRQNVADFRFLPEVEVMRALLPEMRQSGAEIIIVASHLGAEADKALALAVPGIHVIVGGHTHTVMLEPVAVNGTVIVQAGKYMRYLGRLDVTIDRDTWKIVEFTKKDELIPVIDAKIEPDARVAAMIKRYEDQIAPAMEQVLGQAAEDLTRAPTSDHTDTALGNLITDAFRWKAEADVAVYNSGGIRADFNKGPIKVGDIFTLLPFENSLVTVPLRGEQIRRLLAQGLGSTYGTIQVSGLSFRIDTDGKPADVTVGGRPLDDARTYKVATTDFLAEGNDGLTVFNESKDRTYGELARDVFTAYVRRFTPLTAPPAGRIVRTTRR